MTGMRAVPDSERRRASTSKPLMPGSWMSRSAAWGAHWRASARPSSPLPQAHTSKPWKPSTSVRSRRLFSSSSTTRMRLGMVHPVQVGGKTRGEGRAASRGALDGEGTAMQLHEPARERKPQSRALVLGGAAGADLVEFLEDRAPLLAAHPDAGVAPAD